MARATLKVEVSFTTDPYDTPSWVDVTAYAKSVRIKTGRSRSSESFEPGVATVVFDNSARRFDPLYTSGAYYGDLLPNKQIRITATHSAVTYDLFYGFVDGWPQTYNPPGDAECVVTCSDGFKLLSTYKLPASVYELEVLADDPLAWFEFKDESGDTIRDSSGNDRDLTDYYYDASAINRGPKALRIGGSEPVQSGFEPGFVSSSANESNEYVTDTNWSMEWWSYSPLSTTANWQIWSGGPADSVVWKIYQSRNSLGLAQYITVFDNGTANYIRTTSASAFQSAIRHYVVTFSGTTVKIYVDGFEAATTVGGAGITHAMTAMPSFNGGSVSGGAGDDFSLWTISDVAMYGSTLSAARVLAHFQAGQLPWHYLLGGADLMSLTSERVDKVLDLASWPSAARTIDTGQVEYTVLGANFYLDAALLDGATALDYLQKMARSEGGSVYIDHRDGGKLRFAGRYARSLDTRSVTSQYTLSDDGADATAVRYSNLDIQYDENEIINSHEIGYMPARTAGVATVTDAASVTAYGKRSVTVDTEIQFKSAAEKLGSFLTSRYANPGVRVRSIVLEPGANQAAFVAALDIKIGDRLTVRRLPQNLGSAFTVDVIVQGIDHDVAEGVGPWVTTLKCCEIEATAYWVWGTSEWDESTRWG